MKKSTIITLLLFLLSSGFLKAQVNVPVDMQSGRPIINIPIYTVNSGDLSLPVALNYTAGVKALVENGNDEYNIGIGWNLSAGGSILRTVRSLPDDYLGTSPDTRVGWIYGSGASIVNNFAPQTRTDCTGDASNYALINSLVNNNTDTEPDVFNFNFGGYSGQFMFDNNKVIQTLPYQDLKIEPTYASSGGAITSFTITTNNGVVYIFNPVTTVTLKTVPVVDANSVLYLRDKVVKYAQTITYTTQWGLSSIISPSGATINLGYGGSQTDSNGNNFSLETPATFSLPTNIYLANNATGTTYKRQLYSSSITTTNKLLQTVIGKNYQVKINYANTLTYRVTSRGPDPGQSTESPYYLKSINNFLISTIPNVLIKTVGLTYNQVSGRKYLQFVQETNGCVKNPPYEFEYLGALLGPNLNYDGTTLSPSATRANSVLPNPSIDYNQLDYWGYYNYNVANTLVPNLYVYPNEPLQERYRIQQIPNYSGTSYYIGGGANRSANPSVVSAGSLYRIIFPTGGTAKIDYESNQYFDTRANQSFYGGGVRVKAITLHDGVSTDNDIVKNYTYTGGLLVNRPQFAFSIPVFQDASGTIHTTEQYTDAATQTEFFMARSENDLNPYLFDGPDVIYQSVSEKQAGKGSTTYQFSAPATYGQTTSPEYSSPYQWSAVQSQYATTVNPSNSTCMSKGALIDGYNGFPYAPNPNYTFERGLLQAIKLYNESGQLVKEKNYQYIPIYQNTTPSFIYGLACDYFTYSTTDVNTKAFAYGKYKLYTGLNKFQSVEKEITYDPGSNFSKSATVETDYFYTGANHTLLNNSTTSVSNDGVTFSTYKSKYKYPQDYPNTTTAAGADAATAALQRLKDAFINSALIEKISSITKPAQAELITGAQLYKYNSFNINTVLKPLPSSIAVFKSNVPVSFTESSVNTSNQFTYDLRYQPVTTYLEYNKSLVIASQADMQQNLSGIHYDHTGFIPLVFIKGAAANQVVYSSFDYQIDERAYTADLSNSPINPYTFNISTLNGVGPAPARNGYLYGAISVPANFIFSKTGISKGIGQNYTFSCWLKSTVTGSMTVTLSDGTATPVARNISYTNITGVWTNYKIVIPTNTLGASFNIQVQTSAAVMADEMLFYPTMAQVTTDSYSYTDFQKKNSVDTRGNTTFYFYDSFGRPTLTKDDGQNILKRTAYNYSSNYPISSYFLMPLSSTVNAAINFTTGPADGCEPAGIVRDWDFGDGTQLSNGGVNPTHIYTVEGIYNVTLKVTYQGNSVTTTQQITIFYPMAFDLYACGIVAYNTCNNTVAAYGFDGGASCGMSLPVGTNTFSAGNVRYCSNGGGYIGWDMAYDNAPNTWLTLLPNGQNSVTVNVATSGTVTSAKSYTLRCRLVPTNCTSQAVIKTYHISYFAPNCSN